MKKNRIPLYKISIDELDSKQGIQFISLVKNPAISVKGIALSEEVLSFCFKNIEEKQIILGPALIPNKEILRKTDEGHIYKIVFTEEVIEKLLEIFNRNRESQCINLNHTSDIVPAFINQMWIVEDPEYDKSRIYGFDVPKGTLMVEIKITDSEFWNEYVKEQGLYSFSIEGLLGQQLISLDKQVLMDKLMSEIDNLSPVELLSLFRDNVSFDYSGTLNSHEWVRKKALEHIKNGDNVYIITKRNPQAEVLELAFELGIKPSQVIFTSGNSKIDYINKYSIDIHYDNSSKELDDISMNCHNVSIIKV